MTGSTSLDRRVDPHRARRTAAVPDAFVVVRGRGAASSAAYRRLRREVFVARAGPVRRHRPRRRRRRPAHRRAGRPRPRRRRARRRPARTRPSPGRDLGWWRGSRLVVAPDARPRSGVGAALVRAACAAGRAARARCASTPPCRRSNEGLFRRLGWIARERGRRCTATRTCSCDWPIARVAAARRRDQGRRSAPCSTRWPASGGGGPASSATTAPRCPAPTWSPPATRSCPRWSSATRSGPAGARCWSTSTTSPRWAPRPSGCSTPSAPATPPSPAGSCAGSARPSRAWGVPGPRRAHPARRARRRCRHRPRPHRPARARRRRAARRSAAGHRRPRRRLAAGLHRRASGTPPRTAPPPSCGPSPASCRPCAPTAAKDVSMSGLVGTAGMLAEASGCRAVLDVAAVPAPERRVVRRLADLLPRLRDGHRRAPRPPGARPAARLRHQPRPAAS